MATILIVDDLAANRTFLATVLRDHGHRVLEASNGREGLTAIRAEHFDLVITDIFMPVMDGYALVHHLRLETTTRQLPVLFYTAPYSEREARAVSLTSGPCWVLTKPALSEDVLKIVGRVFHRTIGAEPGGAGDGGKDAFPIVGMNTSREFLIGAAKAAGLQAVLGGRRGDLGHELHHWRARVVRP